MTLGQRLRHHRMHKSRLTIVELHRRSMVSVGAISMLENDKYNVSVGKLRQILTALNIKEGQFRI